MTNEELKKAAFDMPNDFALGEEMRKISNTDTVEDETDWKDSYLRVSAEFENYRKRVNRDKEDLVRKTKISMIETILDIDTELGIAMEHVKDEETFNGMTMIISKLEKFLDTHGIKVVQTDVYDEDLHEVISIINTPTKGIFKVAAKGYSIEDKIIRYPKIILSK
jgi:molecular chaperone GrpE